MAFVMDGDKQPPREEKKKKNTCNKIRNSKKK